MPHSDQLAVQRVQPPKAPYDVVNSVLRWLLSSPRRASQVGEHGHAKAGRRMGIRINVDRVPTHEEMVDAARRDHLSLIYLHVGGTAR